MTTKAPQRGRRTGRSVNVLVYLEKEGQPRILRDIIKAVDPNCTPNLMSGTLSTMARNGRVACSRIHNKCAYAYVPGSLVNRTTGKRMDTGKPANGFTPTRRRRAPVASNKPSGLTKATHTAVLVTPNSNHLDLSNAHGGAYREAKHRHSEIIAAQLAAFEAAGGEVQKLAMHECSRPLNHDYRDPRQVASSARGGRVTQRQKQSQARAIAGLDDDSDD